MRSYRTKLVGLAAAFVAALGSPGLNSLRAAETGNDAATTGDAAAAPVAAQPRATTAAFGDWTLRCERAGEEETAAQVCDVTQSIQAPDAQGVVAQVSLLPAEESGGVRALILVPSNMTFARAMNISAGGKGAAALDLAWRHCMPIGCVADGDVPAAVLAKWRKSTGSGMLTYQDAGGQDVEAPVSFRGLAQALDALGETPAQEVPADQASAGRK